jgi:putative two-component system response regulator
MTSTILIVDDDVAGQLTLESILDGQGYTLEFAENGVQALEKISRLLPDIILLDVMMPGMDGFEVCRKIRATPSISEIPIIILTALDDKKSLMSGLEAGADDYLTKPYDRYELLARLMGITRLNRYRKLVDERTNTEETHAQLMTAYEATIDGWARALDLHAQEIEGHSERVAQLTVQLAIIAGVPKNEIIYIRRGALLHDIGKLAIPDSILRKPSALNDEEWVWIKKHPQYANEMLSSIEYLKPALDIPYCHHEKWDGSGYPHGLKGDAIPLAARLFAVVDVWDALTSDRPYRSAWPQEKALEYIQNESGKHFEPMAVDLFRKMMFL